MGKLYLNVMFSSFVLGAVAAVGIWGHAAAGGDSLVAARFLTAATVMGVGHCFYKIVVDRLRASY